MTSVVRCEDATEFLKLWSECGCVPEISELFGQFSLGNRAVVDAILKRGASQRNQIETALAVLIAFASKIEDGNVYCWYEWRGRLAMICAVLNLKETFRVVTKPAGGGTCANLLGILERSVEAYC